MTVLNLTKGWLLHVDTDELFAAHTKDRGQQYGMEGGIVNHAGGRQRAYTVEGEAGTFEVTFVQISLADVTRLRAWKGDTVLFRDHRGQAMYGVFFEVNVTEWKTITWYDARVTLGMVTVVEGV